MDSGIASLEREWNRLAEPYHCAVTRRAFFEGIVNRYSESGRYHHTLQHIGEMLEIIEEHRKELHEYEAVAFAVWFHDIIYDPKSTVNEERSATLAVRTLRRLQVPSRISGRTRDLILMTAGHHSKDSSYDTRLFLDADLAILGSSPHRYARYRDDIRREYAWLDDEEFLAGRRAVLKSFLDRERIFLTDALSAEYEQQARENIRGELDTLDEVKL